MLNRSYPVLVCSLVMAFAGYAIAYDQWAQLVEMKPLCGLMGAFAGVVLAWLGQSPIKPKMTPDA